MYSIMSMSWRKSETAKVKSMVYGKMGFMGPSRRGRDRYIW